MFNKKKEIKDFGGKVKIIGDQYKNPITQLTNLKDRTKKMYGKK